MKKIMMIALLCFSRQLFAQPSHTDSVPPQYFVTNSKVALMEKLAALPCGIRTTDTKQVLLTKLDRYLTTYLPQTKYADDRYALEAARQALKSVQQGGYGIGAVLIDAKGNILEKAHNEQLQQLRTDLHGEMTLLTKFEQSPTAKKYRNGLQYKQGVVCISSAEPCPMCTIRLATAGINTRYTATGPDDGMTARADCLPAAWRDLVKKISFTKGNCSPELQKISHLLFFTFLLENENPYLKKKKIP